MQASGDHNIIIIVAQEKGDGRGVGNMGAETQAVNQQHYTSSQSALRLTNVTGTADVF